MCEKNKVKDCKMMIEIAKDVWIELQEVKEFDYKEPEINKDEFYNQNREV